MNKEIENIIQECILKDQKAQFRFFKIYASWALSICKRYIRNEYRSKEIMQDAFLKIFTHMDSYDSNKGELKSWMSRIIINCALTTIKKEAFNNSFSSIDDTTRMPIEESTFFEYSSEEIMKFLHKMPIGYKTVFNMAVMDEYSHKEIAAELNISEITSRSQLRKAKKWLQENISINALKSNF